MRSIEEKNKDATKRGEEWAESEELNSFNSSHCYGLKWDSIYSIRLHPTGITIHSAWQGVKSSINVNLIIKREKTDYSGFTDEMICKEKERQHRENIEYREKTIKSILNILDQSRISN